MMKKGEWTVALFISLTTDAGTCAIAGVVEGKARYYWMRIGSHHLSEFCRARL